METEANSGAVCGLPESFAFIWTCPPTLASSLVARPSRSTSHVQLVLKPHQAQAVSQGGLCR
eukprot:4365584-Prymnesium_polylepis.1